MSFFDRLFGRRDQNEAVRPLYNAVIARGREPHWYVDGGVPDTIDAAVATNTNWKNQTEATE